MKMKLLVIIAVTTISIFYNQAISQKTDSSYKTALGIKFGGGEGLTLKHFITDKHALEVTYFWNQNAHYISGFYEIYGNIKKVPGLKWYTGPGAHIDFYNSHSKILTNKTIVGFGLIMGLDYKINNAPLNISFDLQPSYELNNNSESNRSWGGLGIRYTF